MTNSALPALTNQPHVALITSAAQGIGRAIVLRFAEDGLDIAVADLKSQRVKLDGIADESDDWVDGSKCRKIVVKLVGTLTDFGKIFDTNVRGTFLCLHAAEQVMIKHERGGRIISDREQRQNIEQRLWCVESCDSMVHTGARERTWAHQAWTN
ncbi:uncharacterized protein EDB91DRAFT_1335515 [Suillus paluster]|uniref:uncharacterized protein n=1 Tax=Suillus paluster TaxID=48578 RepID=UPI001B86E7CD|nr:uncharacterized protein EDB91DRAFT_1335515 [Suillus paluster]KAG1745108.1 hypothetical protein EDB91DRAFT_1335515 [Suillus paluster]